MSYRNKCIVVVAFGMGRPHPGVLAAGRAHPQCAGSPAWRSANRAYHHPRDVGSDPGDFDEARKSEGRRSTPLDAARHHLWVSIPVRS